MERLTAAHHEHQNAPVLLREGGGVLSSYPEHVPYPGRPSSHEPDPELARWTASGRYLPGGVKDYVVREYLAGRSLRELAEITGRSHGAVRNILQRAGVPRRGRGAARINP